MDLLLSLVCFFAATVPGETCLGTSSYYGDFMLRGNIITVRADEKHKYYNGHGMLDGDNILMIWTPTKTGRKCIASYHIDRNDGTVTGIWGRDGHVTYDKYWKIIALPATYFNATTNELSYGWVHSEVFTLHNLRK